MQEQSLLDGLMAQIGGTTETKGRRDLPGGGMRGEVGKIFLGGCFQITGDLQLK